MLTYLHNFEIPDEEYIAWLREKTPAEKIKMASDLHRLAQQILAAEIQHEQPFLTDDQVCTIVSWRMLNDIDVPELSASDLSRK